MAFNVNEFRREAQKVDKSLRAESSRSFARWTDILRKFYLDVVERTPLDTGEAKSGWVLAVGAPSGFKPPSHKEAGRVPAGRPRHSGMLPLYKGLVEKNEEDMFQRLNTANEAFKTRGPASPRTTVFITNHVPYIKDLEQGTSPQAPAGISRPAMAAALADMKAPY